MMHNSASVVSGTSRVPSPGPSGFEDSEDEISPEEAQMVSVCSVHPKTYA